MMETTTRRRIDFARDNYGYVTWRRIPRETWLEIRAAGAVNYLDDEWLGDCGSPLDEPGWRYAEGAFRVLLAAGYDVAVEGVGVGSVEELPNVLAELERRDAEEEERAERRAAVERELRELFRDAEHPDDCAEVEGAERLYFPGDRKADVYGGGHWHHLTGTHLWCVRNNGHDGGDWSLNNYGTRGAGALALRVPRTAEVEEILSRALEAESERFSRMEADPPDPVYMEGRIWAELRPDVARTVAVLEREVGAGEREDD